MIYFSNMKIAHLLPTFFSEHDPRPARQQLNENYAHGGGWRPMSGWTLGFTQHGEAIATYPGDPPFRETSRATLRDETLILFPYSFFAIVQADGSYEIGRVD